MNFKLGPSKTNLSNFQGFGFGAAKVAPKTGGAGPSARRPPGSGNSSAGVAALFQESLDEDEETTKKTRRGVAPVPLPSFAKPTQQAIQAQKQAEALQEQDPTIFQYDEVIDDIKADDDSGPASGGLAQRVQIGGLEQKKRVGLTVREGSDMVRSGSARSSKYIEKVIVATDRRKVEQQIVEDKLLKKEKDARKDAEVFVTEAFKEELKRRSKFQEEMDAQDLRDSINAAEKKKDGLGFASFHGNLLRSGMASSRGAEQVREVAAPRTEAEDEELKKEELKDELKDELKEEEEDDIQQEPRHGVQEAKAVEPESAKEKKAEEAAVAAVEREEKVMSAKERYLARKRAAAGADPQGA